MKKVWLCENEQARWFEFEEPTDMPNEISVTMLTEQPAQRTWVGLTDEERAVIVEVNTFDDHGYDIWCSGDWVARAVEAKLKEKNNG